MQHPAITAEQCARHCPSRCGAGISRVTGVILFPPSPPSHFLWPHNPSSLFPQEFETFLKEADRVWTLPTPAAPSPI